MTDKIEFYNADGEPGRDLVATVDSGMVPHINSLISIRQETWEVVSVSYALDDADDCNQRKMRANVELQKV